MRVGVSLRFTPSLPCYFIIFPGPVGGSSDIGRVNLERIDEEIPGEKSGSQSDRDWLVEL